MAKHKEDNTFSEEVEIVPTTVVPVTVVVSERSVRLLSFAQWAARRNIKNQHMRGIMAHIKDYTRDRSMEDWDKAVSSY